MDQATNLPLAVEPTEQLVEVHARPRPEEVRMVICVPDPGRMGFAPCSVGSAVGGAEKTTAGVVFFEVVMTTTFCVVGMIFRVVRITGGGFASNHQEGRQVRHNKARATSWSSR